MKVGFFVWEVAWDRILMIDQHKRREWVMLNRCFMCKMD